MVHNVKRLFAVLGGALFLIGGTASSALAQGYGLYEHGTCQTGRAGAGVASPCDDGSAIFFNPAGLALDMRPVISGGATEIGPRGTFTNSTTNVVGTLNAKWYPAPAAYVAVPVAKRLMIGAGLFAPYGLTTDWPLSFEGRYLGYYSSLKSIYIQPTVAARLTDNVMIGVGIDITHTTADLRQRVDLSGIPVLVPGLGAVPLSRLGVPVGTDFADVKITGSGNKVGAHFGVLVKANDQFSFGARYLTDQTVEITNGNFQTQQISTGLKLAALGGAPIDSLIAPQFGTGGALATQSASTSVPLPGQFVAGIAVSATPDLKIFADYQYVHWKKFDVLAITKQDGSTVTTPENYKDTNGVRLGVEHTGPAAILRFGIDVHSGAAPDEVVTPRLPEASRWELGAGVGIPAKSNFRLDLGYLYVHQNDRAGRTIEGPNNGNYHYYANLFSAQFVIHF